MWNPLDSNAAGKVGNTVADMPLEGSSLGEGWRKANHSTFLGAAGSDLLDNSYEHVYPMPSHRFVGIDHPNTGAH